MAQCMSKWSICGERSQVRSDRKKNTTVKYPILRQGAVNILAREAGAVEQERNLEQPKDNGPKCASHFLPPPSLSAAVTVE
jgi:hypothetical protein